MVTGVQTCALPISYATFSPYYGSFFNDKWNVTRKLSVSLGMRLEYEGGPTERFNRMIGYYDPRAKNFLTDTAERLYALNPIAERPVSTFKVLGGVTFPGVNDISRNSFQGQFMFMPRLALAYAVDRKTVIRVSAGTFYDTLNVTNNSPNQTGFNRTTTNSSIANNAGEIWINSDPARGIPPVADPFPLRSNGTRFDTSSNGQLGVDTQNGRGFTFIGFGTGRARQQRWRAGIQRQIGNTGVISVTYAGSYSDNVNLTLDLNPVPGQYWSSGNTRNSTAASFLNSGITNPFRITNFPTLARDNPALYQDMNSQGFFTNSNVSRAQLLKEFPQMTGLSQSMTPLGRVRTNGIEASYNRRFSKGYTYMLTYTGTEARTADWLPNAYMRKPAWRQGNNARPHRFTALGTYQLPFGKGKLFLKEGWGRKILGGMQIAGTFEWQPGPLLDWGNIFYYGDINNIKLDNSTFDTWFNSAGTTCTQTPTANSGFERCANRNPDSYQNRTFPSRLPGVRKDFTMQNNANLQKEIPLMKERIKLFARVDLLNVFNRNQFDGPSTDPTNTNFGRITLQTAAVNRFVQFQLRIQY